MSDRHELAQSLLLEAVYTSRGAQAASHALHQGAGSADDADAGQCGLGERAAVILDLSPRGQELFEQLFAGRDQLEDAKLEALRGVMGSWIKRQDALDRKRNHFLKAFRKEHGFDRRSYNEVQLAEYEAGLDQVNGENRAQLSDAAQQLLDVVD